MNGYRRCGMMWYIYTIKYYSVTKIWKFAVCENMDGFKGYYAKWDLRQIPYDLTYVQNLKNKTNETEQKQTQREQKNGCQKGVGWGVK